MRRQQTKFKATTKLNLKLSNVTLLTYFNYLKHIEVYYSILNIYIWIFGSIVCI